MTVHSIEEYRVGWVCALTHELTAARAMLDEEHNNPHKRAEHDSNTYVLGRVHRHNVVIACLPGGTYGNNSAAVVATNMMKTFTQIRFGLMVGIGGGIPDLDRGVDIRLGDIVVSYPSQTYGGVVQFDIGKSIGEGMFERTGSLNRPPTVLLNAITTLSSTHEMYGNQIIETLATMYKRFPRLAKSGFAYPGLDKDILYSFKSSEKASTISGSQPPSQEHRLPRDDISPEVHYGIVASSNKLIKDARERDRLAVEFQAKCVEMEAAGLMNDFPCIVVRGICDYADHHKNDIWQKYAAAVAAAYTKELLEVVAPEMVEKEERVQETLNKVTVYLAKQEEHNQRQETRDDRRERRHEDEILEKCHQVFKTSNYEAAKNLNPTAVKGTCKWVFNHKRYRSWRSSKHSDLLWISADPGCGKSVLSRLLVDTVLRTTDSTSTSSSKKSQTICYFFFKDDRPTEGLSTALCALLHQLLSQQPWLRHHALPAFTEDAEKLQDETDKLWRILLDMISDPKAQHVICVLDALDECRDADRQKLINFLCQFYNTRANDGSSSCSLKWLVTSRPYQDLQAGFEKLISALPSIRLHGEDMNDQIREEINAVIQQQMQDIIRELTLSAEQAENITKQLLAMEHRTYLWLYLAIDDIKHTIYHSLRPGAESFPLLPTSVEEAYEKILKRVTRKDQKENVKTILTIMTGAQRPLTVAEMALALDLATRDTRPSSFDDFRITKEYLKDKIRHWCGLFVFINHDRLYFLHQTAKEFLLSYPGGVGLSNAEWKHCLKPCDVETSLSKVCILFLGLEPFDQQLSTDIDGKSVQSRNEINARIEVVDKGEASSAESFLHYASEHWGEHVRGAEGHLDEETQSVLRQLYETQSNRFTRWSTIMWLRSVYRYTTLWMNMNRVQLAAFNGHHLFLQWLFDTNHSLQNDQTMLNSFDNAGRTALAWATERGHIEVAKLLVEKGADISFPSISTAHYGNALQAAARGGNIQIVRWLLEKGASLKDKRGKHGNALYAASHAGHEHVVQLLLENGADVNGKGGDCGSALQAASLGGHLRVVQLLIKRGAKGQSNWW